MTIRDRVNEKILEAYEVFKDDLNNETNFPMLNAMCKNCEQWCGKEHDFEECRDKPCFVNALGYMYLVWETGYECCG